MAATATDGAPASRDAQRGTATGAGLGGGTVYFLGGDERIPVRRYGDVPPPPEPEWEIEPGRPDLPATIAEYGGTAVLLAGLVAALIAGCLLFLR